MKTEINKVLIANRGEIALRIMRTLKAMGIEAHAIYSDADKDSQHTLFADYSHPLGENSAKLSYLNIDKIIQIARKAKIDAVHPGYGFLSENSEFVKKLAKAGIAFIGPDAKSMEALGDKINAKKLAKSLKIPLLQKPEKGGKYTYPLLIKAAGGGGGRGMRVVRKASELEAALESARREAKSAFNSESLFIEPYLENVRHIEVQIIADKSGDVRHIFDRDCSLQRNHQKLIEEAPAKNIPASARNRMYQAAIKLCKAAKYSNLATVEFLLDKKGNFYFLEVNTRLQVEHTVSEEISGLDFVKLQIEIAAGKKLKHILPDKIPCCGHAIQARICAEIPECNFSPSSGTISNFSLPTKDFIRLDSGFTKGDTISHEYDSLIAKLIVRGENRENALSNLLEVLPETKLHGIVSNLGFLFLLVNSKDFKDLKIHTRYIAGFLEKVSWEKLYKNPASLYLTSLLKRDESDIWAESSSFRIDGSSPTPSAIFLINQSVKVKAEKLPLKNPGVKISKYNSGTWIEAASGSLKIESIKAAGIKSQDKTDNSALVKTSLPGKVIKLSVKAGAIVKKGSELLVIESMKMEHIIKANFDAEVVKINVKENDFVTPGNILMELKGT